MDQDIELCRFLIKNARNMQEECQALIDDCAVTTRACNEILKSCQNKYSRINNLQKVSDQLLSLAGAILDADVKSLPEKDAKQLPALVDKNNVFSETIDAVSKCLNEIHIVGMSQKTVLTWPIKDAPKPLRKASILLANYPVDINSIEWVSVVPPEGDSQWTFEHSPFKAGFGVRFSSGHEVIYGLS